MRFLRTPNLPWREVDGRTVIIQPRAGKVHELDPVGSLLWLRADGTRELAEIATEVAERFDVGADAAENDAREFYLELARLELVANVAHSH